MVKKESSEIAKLAVLVERGFGAITQDFHDLRDHMDSKFAQVDARLENIETELRVIRSELLIITRRLDALEEKVNGLTGYAKEIDELRERIRAIEYQLKMKSENKSVRA